MIIPRIRGKVGVIEDPPQYKGQFAFEVSIWTFDGEEQLCPPIGPFGPFKTEAEAKEALRRAAEEACGEIEMLIAGSKSGQYLDMKNGGVLRKWQLH